MTYQTAYAEVHASASVRTLWDLLAGTESWPTWAPTDEAVLERPGDSEREGLGAIRRFRTGRIVARELVVAFEPEHLFAYRLLSGLPFRDYLAIVTLTSTDDGATVAWKATFRSAIPGLGRPFRRKMTHVLANFAAALARAGEKRDAPSQAWTRSTPHPRSAT